MLDDRRSFIEGEVGRIRRYWNIPVSDADMEEEEELGNDEEKDPEG